jgi:hypothetical protein
LTEWRRAEYFQGSVKLSIPESPLKRVAITIGAAAVIMVMAALIYLATSEDATPQNINGLKIIAAAHSYTRQLIANKQPIPRTVPLSELLTHGFLKPADVGPFQGLDAVIVLLYDTSNPRAPLMRVHMTDGSYLVLFRDGTTQQEAAR